MKIPKELYPRIADYMLLYRSAKKAGGGVRNKYPAQEFFFHLEAALFQLREELLSGSYEPGEMHTFTIHDPKERNITVAPFRDRVVHHAVVSVLEPYYEPSFIYDSYACRKGKGTHRAVRRLQRFLRKNKWYLKSDVEHFFETVDLDVLLSMLEKKFSDARLLSLLEKIFYAHKKELGLPIGNLTSQFFANVYLDRLDHFVKQELRVKPYVRYMDDFVLLENNKEKLKIARRQITEYCRDELCLRIKERATFINQRLNGVSFLGVRVFPDIIRVQRQKMRLSLQRLYHTEWLYERGAVDEAALYQSAQSIIAHWEQYDTLAVRRKIFEERETALSGLQPC